MNNKIPVIKKTIYRYGYEQDTEVQYFKDEIDRDIYFLKLYQALDFSQEYKKGTCNWEELNYHLGEKHSYWIRKDYLDLDFNFIITI